MKTPDVFESTTLSDLQCIADAVAEHAPELSTRTERALNILLSGKCVRVDDDLYEVLGSDDGTAYVVTLSAGVCPCPDFRHRAPEHKGKRYCKHLLAAKFLVKLERSARRPSARAVRVVSFRRHQRAALGRAA